MYMFGGNYLVSILWLCSCFVMCENIRPCIMNAAFHNLNLLYNLHNVKFHGRMPFDRCIMAIMQYLPILFSNRVLSLPTVLLDKNM